MRGINIDPTAPRVAVTGVRNGAIYPGQAPAAHCSGSDALSGLDHCTLARHVRGEVVTTTATARDRAGNTRSVSVRYTVARFYVAGAVYRNGAYQVRVGHTYVIVALTGGTTRPRYYDAAPRGGTLHRSGRYLRRSGTQSGLRRYTLVVRMNRGMNRHTRWNLGVKSGGQLHLISVEPHA